MHMTRKITVTGANIVFLISAASVILFQFFFVIVFGQSSGKIYSMLVISEFLFILTPALIYIIVKKAGFRQTFRLNKPGLVPSGLIVLTAIPAYCVALMLNNVVAYLLQFIGKLPAQPIPVPQNLSELAVGILIIGVTPAICEESLHRGLLLKAYEKRGSYRSIVIVSLFFGLFHFDITNLLGPVFLGLIIGYYVIRTNSIFAGMLAHFLNNAISELADYFSGNRSMQDSITITSQDLVQVVLLGLAGIIVTGLLLLAFRKLTENRGSITPPISSKKKDVASVISHWPVIILIALYVLMLLLFILTIIALKMLGK